MRALFLVFGIVACSASRSNSVWDKPVSGPTAILTSTEEGEVLRQSDVNGDGKPDVLTYLREVQGKEGRKEQRVVRKVMDLNLDGRMDLSQTFDDQERLLREELDLDFDGKVDAIREYKDGVIAREQVSSRFDGRFDIRKFYENGVLVLKQVDNDGDGVFEELQYFENNRLARIGWDRNGDGNPESFEENPSEEQSQ